MICGKRTHDCLAAADVSSILGHHGSTGETSEDGSC